MSMMGKVKSLDARLLTRRCVECGYDGILLQNGQAVQCARCGCDLQKRPARSYAEMEGLVGQPLTIDKPVVWPGEQTNMLQRWLAFLFLWAVLLGAIACLSMAAIGAA